MLEACDRYYGLAPKEVRKFAFELAESIGINHPNQWDENKMAGVDWFSNFMKRHPSLSPRNPEATSLARATSFNPENVKCFFNQISRVLELHKFEGNDIRNMDETGITTVQIPNHVVARRGSKQVGAMTSGERRTLVTITCAVQALGNCIPPFLCFLESVTMTILYKVLHWVRQEAKTLQDGCKKTTFFYSFSTFKNTLK